MSLVLDPEEVEQILLADGWHEIEKGSLMLDSYEFIEQPSRVILHAGGDSGICAVGFEAYLLGSISVIAGPLSSILAVKRDRVRIYDRAL